MSELPLIIELREPTPEDYRNQSTKSCGNIIVKEEIQTKQLETNEILKLLKRAPKIADKEDDETEWNMREKSGKPPTKGERLKMKFPPEENLEKPVELLKEEEEIRKELKVLRIMPQGEDLENVPTISVTFNQPMVPITGVDDLKSYPVPVKIVPEIEGEWRWVGTKCVQWKATHRIPKSMNFKVVIPKGVKSQLGVMLEKEVEFEFSTITLRLRKKFPVNDSTYEALGKDAIVFLEFNQKIDREKILEFISVSLKEKKFTPIILSKEEVQKRIDSGTMKTKRKYIYKNYSRWIRNCVDEYHLFMCFKEELDLDQRFAITLGKGATGVEGPRPTPENQVTYFRTYEPFRKTRENPRSTDHIVPCQHWTVYFSNNIELEGFNGDELVNVDPPVKNLVVSAHVKSIIISGRTKGSTKYTVTFSQKINDVYGQNLQAEEKVIFHVRRARRNLYGFHQNQMIVHDITLNEKPQFEVVSVNIDRIRVRIHQVEPWEYMKSRVGVDYDHYNYQASEELDKYLNAGKNVFDGVIEVKNIPDELNETVIDLKKFLQNEESCTGQLLLYVEPVKECWDRDWKYRPRVCTWIQVTRLAVSALSAPRKQFYGFCSNLQTGMGEKDVNFTFQKRARKVVENKDDYKDFQVSMFGEKDGSCYGARGSIRNRDNMLIARKGTDVAFIPNIAYFGSPTPRFLWYLVNDRNLYKPKETVSIKGIIRKLTFLDKERDLKIFPEESVLYTWYDARGSVLKKGSIATNKFGSFKLDLVIPDNVNLGTCRVVFGRGGGSTKWNHTFKIQEFRTPEFTSSAKVDPGPYIAGSIAIVDGKAEYFSGGGLSGCDVTWKVKQSTTVYRPVGFSFSGFNFTNSYRKHEKRISRSLPNIRFSAFEKFRRFATNKRSAPPQSSEKILKGKTDGNGNHKMTVDCKDNKDYVYKAPVSVTCDLTIQDINRQVMASTTTFIVHPSKLYVGIKMKKHYCKRGEILPVDIVVCDIDGNIVEGKEVNVQILNRYWERKGYDWIENEEEIGNLKFVSEEEPKELSVKLPEGGNYYLVASTADEFGRKNYSSCSMWVSGRDKISGGKKIERESVRLIPNKKTFEVGDIAKVLVTSPFVPAAGLLTVICNGFSLKREILMKEESMVVDIPIERHYSPRVSVAVILTGISERNDENGRKSLLAPKRSAYAYGSNNLNVPPKQSTLKVELTAKKKIMKPGEIGHVNVKVISQDNDFKMEKGNIAVSLLIVDEAVLSLTGYKLPHPISSFIVENYTSCSPSFMRERIVMKNWNSIKVLKDPTEVIPSSRNRGFGSGPGRGRAKRDTKGRFLDKSKRTGMSNGRNFRGFLTTRMKVFDSGDYAKSGSVISGPKGIIDKEESTIEVRTNFNPLACFVQDFVADENGEAKIEFKLPDNLTRYRVWAIVMGGSEHFGLGESSIQAQLPVAIRPSLPRFLNFGDCADFTVVIQNQTLEKILVNVAVRMTNLRLTDPQKVGLQVVIPYTKRAELRFPVKTYKCGTARFQVVASVPNMDFSDAIEKELPIFTPSTCEAFATYGTIQGDATIIQSIVPPSNIFNQFGGLKITTSSTALQSLTDAFLYLFRYEYDCIEQISSRMLSINALHNFLKEFNVPGMPTTKEIKEVMQFGLKKIRGAMRSDGSIGFWNSNSRVNVYCSIFVAHNLIRCKEQKVTRVDRTSLIRSKSFCQKVQHYTEYYGRWYGPWSKASLRSFALYVLTMYSVNGLLKENEIDKVVKEGENLWSKFEKFLSHEGKVWLMFALFTCSKEKEKHPIVVKVLDFIKNNVNETPETANFVTNYGDDGKLVMLHSNRRTDGIILECLCHVDPKNYLIPKIVKGLLAHRKKGRWRSTQENVFILMALKKYFVVFEGVTPDFLTKVWLGEDFVGEVKFKGREVDYKSIEIPMKYIVEEDSKEPEKKDLVLWKQGPGRLYYRLGMDYAPKSLDLKPLDYGFIVKRNYEGVVNKEDVKKDEKTGMWSFKAGSLIRVKLKLTNVSRRTHVALVDFLPAGCEVLNPELKETDFKAPKSASTMRNRNIFLSPYRWRWWYSYRKWYEHVNLRDERVEVFTSYLHCGTHEYGYIMRATSFGTFVVPPAKAEEMYSPELFGRSGTEKVVIF